MLKHIALIAFSLSFLVSFGQERLADSIDQKKIIQFTGVIFTPDSSSVIPGVHVYVPTAGRGTTTNPYGFFSLPVLEGDSVIFSAVGFKRQFYIVPEHRVTTSLKLVITMEEDVTFLSEVEVFPYPTEAMFKEAILSLETPNQRNFNNMNAWLNSEYMNTAYANLPPSAQANYQYYMRQQAQSIRNNYQAPVNNYMNPFAWARFIRSLKEN